MGDPPNILLLIGAKLHIWNVKDTTAKEPENLKLTHFVTLKKKVH